VTGQVKILRYIAASFMDYLLPTAQEVPRIEIGHVETPSPFTEYGVKGGGEGGRMIARRRWRARSRTRWRRLASPSSSCR